MTSRVKPHSKLGSLLTKTADRGGRMSCDIRRFPPSRVFRRAERAGYVTRSRESLGWGVNGRVTVFTLTPSGWALLGRTPPTVD